MDTYNFHAPLSAHKRANTAVIMLCIFLVYQGLMLVLGLVEFAAISSAVSNGDYSNDAGGAVSAIKWLLTFGQSMLFIATAVVFLMWVHRANRVLHDKGIQKLEHTPGWAVGWFFVPIANLFKPYLLIKEIFQRSDPDRVELSTLDEPSSEGVGWITAWWIGWLLSGAVDTLASVAFQQAGNIVLRYSALKIAFLSDLLFTATTALLIVVISKIDNRQRALATRQTRPQMPAAEPEPEPTAQTPQPIG